MKLKSLGLIVFVGMLQSCATSGSQEKLLSANYGSPPPSNYQEIIKNRISRTLIDPTSPKYEFAPPSQGYTKKSALFNTSEQFGWRVCGNVNAKNKFGGYKGREPFFTLFKDGQLVTLIQGDNEFRAGFVADACSRSAG